MAALLFYFQDDQLFIIFLMKLCSRMIDHIQFCCLKREYLLSKKITYLFSIFVAYKYVPFFLSVHACITEHVGFDT